MWNNNQCQHAIHEKCYRSFLQEHLLFGPLQKYLPPYPPPPPTLLPIVEAGAQVLGIPKVGNVGDVGLQLHMLFKRAWTHHPPTSLCQSTALHALHKGVINVGYRWGCLCYGWDNVISTLWSGTCIRGAIGRRELGVPFKQKNHSRLF